MADGDDVFRFVSTDEFRKMDARQRADYVMRAVQALIRRLKEKAAGDPPTKKR